MKKDFQIKTLFFRVFAVFCLIIFSQIVHAQISGTVFRDFNSNGTIDTTLSFRETGQIGVIVKAYNASGAEVGTSTTDKNGIYFITGVSGPLRIEFSNIPNLDFSSFSGGTSVQFVNGGATNVNFGINYPSDYCQKNPQVIIPCYALKTPSNGSLEPILVEAGIFSGGLANENLGTTTISSSPLSTIVGNDNATPPIDGKSRIYDAFWSQVGTVNGLAWHPATNTVLAASFFKANAFFPNGPNDIALGSIYAINRNTNPNTVTTIFTANAGTDTHSYSDQFRDSTGRNDAGKKGWGDIDLSEDGTILYAVNLFDKKLYAIPVIQSGGNLILNTSKSVNIIPFYLNVSPCSNNDWAPGAIKIKRGKVYVSVTCTAETSQLKTDLKGYVYSFDVNTVPTEIGSTGNNVSNFSLSYARTFEGGFGACTPGGIHEWNPWKNDASILECNSSPWVMDLEFDANNNLLIGVRNRTGDQFDFTGLSGGYGTGFLNLGDVIKATPNGSIWDVANADQNADPTDETFEDGVVPGPGGSHNERLHGGMAVHLGLNELITGATNGGQYFGWSVNDLNSGATKRTYVVGSGDGNFVKASIVGDIELLCAVAPIQIGNRIWFDKDQDGVQDADEVALPNIKVALYDSTGIKVSEVTTNAMGEYYFDTLNISGGKLLPLSRYQIRIAKTNISDSLHLTNSNIGANDFIDSDGITVGRDYVISVTTGNYGENNHTYDMGFLSCIKLSVGSDISLCQPADGNYKLMNAPSGQMWNKLTGVSTINSTTGSISGLLPGTHEYIIKYITTTECSDTIKITVKAVPSSDITFLDPECTNGQISINASFTIVNPQNVVKFDFSGGSTFTGTKSYASLSNITPANSVITLPNPTVTKNYTIRLYNQGGTCFTDKTVELRHIECPSFCPANVCQSLDSSKN